MNIEAKLKRLEEIKEILQSQGSLISESVLLLEEAAKLKEEIEIELNKLENWLLNLSNSANNSSE